MVHSRVRHHLASATSVAIVVMAMSTVGMTAGRAQATETMHTVGGQVVDEATAALANPCPDVIELVTGSATSGPPSSETVACLASAAAKGVRLPAPGTPCSGTHVGTGTSVVVRDDHHRVLAHARLQSGQVSDSNVEQCTFAFSVRVPTRAAYFFVLAPGRWVSYTADELRASHWHAGLQV